MERVGRRAEQDRRRGSLDQIEPRPRVHPAAGNDQCAARDQRIVGAPETNERPERKRQHRPVRRRRLGGVEHELPAVDPPPPIVGRVVHRHRPAVRPRRLVVADVAFQRPRAVGGRRRRRTSPSTSSSFVVGGNSASCSSDVSGSETPRELAGVELVRRQNLREQLIQSLELHLLERRSIKRLQTPSFLEGQCHGSWRGSMA